MRVSLRVQVHVTKSEAKGSQVLEGERGRGEGGEGVFAISTPRSGMGANRWLRFHQKNDGEQKWNNVEQELKMWPYEDLLQARNPRSRKFTELMRERARMEEQTLST